MDKFDKAILKALQSNASLPVAQIADQVSLSKTACWHRIQKLESSGVIKERVALLDQKKVNLGLTAYMVIRTNRHDEEWLDLFARVVTDIPEILEIHRLSGDMDYLLKAVVTDMEGYDRMYKKLISSISLFDVSSSFVMETVKSTTVLPLDYV
jgi:Lrp/AsnC family transcriptional regulator